jgi:hypothetical protein
MLMEQTEKKYDSVSNFVARVVNYMIIKRTLRGQ